MASALSKRLERLEELVKEQMRLAASRAQPRLRVICRADTPADEIAALESTAASQAGLDSDSIQFVHRVVIKPAPVFEPERELRIGPVRGDRAEIAEPSWRSKHDAQVIEPEPEERAMPLEYPNAGVA